MSIEPRGTVMCPPTFVIANARDAFREHADPPALHAPLVFDTIRDDISRDRTHRLLMFVGETFDLTLTVTRTSRGKAVGGAFMSNAALVVGIRRPLRATIVLSADEAGTLSETVIPGGTARVIVRDPMGQTYESNWLTL
jgi:hypothetical protein